MSTEDRDSDNERDNEEEEELENEAKLTEEDLTKMGIEGVKTVKDFVDFLKADTTEDKEKALKKMAEHGCRAALVVTKFIPVVGPAISAIGAEILSFIFEEKKQDVVGEVNEHTSRKFAEMKKQMSKEFGAVHDKLGIMTSQIDHGFNDVKRFLSDLNVEERITSEVDAMEVAMRACINAPGESSKNEFLSTEFDSPLTLMSRLKTRHNTSEHPLHLAMNDDLYKTKKTYRQWKKMVSNLMYRLNILYYFYAGIKQLDKNLIASHEKEIGDIKEFLAGVGKSYRINWKNSVKKLLDDLVSNDNFPKVISKAEKIVNAALKAMHSDVFYALFVYDKDQCFAASLPHDDPRVVFKKKGTDGLRVYVYGASTFASFHVRTAAQREHIRYGKSREYFEAYSELLDHTRLDRRWIFPNGVAECMNNLRGYQNYCRKPIGLYAVFIAPSSPEYVGGFGGHPSYLNQYGPSFLEGPMTYSYSGARMDNYEALREWFPNEDRFSWFNGEFFDRFDVLAFP